MCKGTLWYKNKEKAAGNKNTSNKKGPNKGGNCLHLIFYLPDYVDHGSVTYYSYCFEQSDSNLMQYAILYFEFNVKDSNQTKKKEEDKFTTVTSMIFDSGAASGPYQNHSTTSNNQSNGSNSTTMSNRQHNGSSFYSSRAFSNSFHANNEDVKRMKKTVIVMLSRRTNL